MVERVLDPCCGQRMMWFDPHHEDVIFGDIRKERLEVTDRSHGKQDGTRVIQIAPDAEMDFRDLPHDNDTFSLVVWDPPHLVRAGPRSWLAAKYGKLGQSWKDDLRLGFHECFRVLKPDGVLIFKWNETQIPVSEILPLSPYPPLFGHKSGKQQKTHWMTFMRPPPKEPDHA